MKKICPTCHGSGSVETTYKDTIPCIAVKKPCPTCGGCGEVDK